jgi:transposase InsO family protein/transposase-like protein
MYSYEDRIRAVKLYIKLDKRIAATIVQLGYPTKNTLKTWYQEYEQRQDVSMGYARSRLKYSAKQKQFAVDQYLDHGRCITGTIKALGYPCWDTLTSWIGELAPETRKRLVSKGIRAVHSEAFKNAAVIDLCMRPISAQASANKLGVDRTTLYNWKNKLLGPEAPASMKNQDDLQPLPDRAELEKTVESLKRDIHKLRLEHDLLKMAAELLKKGQGINLILLSNREKTLMIDALRHTYAVSELLVELGLARSSYFYHRARLLGPDKYVDVRLAITDVFELNHRCYGYRRIKASLSKRHLHISEGVVRRLMGQAGLSIATPRRRRYHSYGGEISPAPENIINRDFHAATPNEKWLTDITEFHIPAGKVYLSPMIDCFDGMVISWSIGTRPDAKLVNTMLDAAIQTVEKCDGRPVVHSDRGAHYRWPGWLTRMGDAKLVRSMSRKGCSPDNSACEGFFGRLKNELFYSRSWQAITIEQFIQIVDSYIHWYNEKRIKISLGSLSPLEYRQSLGLITQTSPSF